MSQTTLYRLSNDAGELLYIGISETVMQRFAQHHDKPWWSEVAAIRIEHFPSRHLAAEAERCAIMAERPRYNVVYNRANRAARLVAAAVELIKPPREPVAQIALPPVPCWLCHEDITTRRSVWHSGGRIRTVHRECAVDAAEEAERREADDRALAVQERRIAVMRGDIA